METLIAQLRRACGWVLGHIDEFGGDPTRLTLSGHSAGAHLGALMRADPALAGAIKGALLLSGLYDLAPLQGSFLKELIALTDEEVAHYSPLRHAYGPSGCVSLLVGARETAPFHAQSAAFARHLAQAGVDVETATVAQADHMSLIADLGTGGTGAALRLARLLAPAP